MAGIPKALQQLHGCNATLTVICPATVPREASFEFTQIFTDICTHQLCSGRALVVSAFARVQGSVCHGWGCGRPPWPL